MTAFNKFYFTTQVPREGCPIASIRVPEFYARDVISIVDTSTLIAQNSFFEKDIEIELDEYNLTYFVDKSGFVITDKFKNSRPLFYAHELEHPIYSDDPKNPNIVILDSNGNKVESILWIYDCSKNKLFHNWAFDTSNISDIYFIQYPRADANGNLIDPDHTEFLSSLPAFRSASAEDFTILGKLSPDKNAYILNESDGQPYYWRITLPRSGKYTLRYTNDGLLRLNIPSTEQSEPWYLRIQNAQFITKQLTKGLLLKYQIPEFYMQNFLPFAPIKFIAERESQIIGDHIVYVGENNIKVTNKTPLDVKIYNVQNQLIRAITTDVFKQGKTIGGIAWETNLISAIDKTTGRFSLKRKIRPGEKVLVSFYYEEKFYTYNAVNLNPLYNPEILTQKIGILCKPNNVGCNKTIGHITMIGDTIKSSSFTEVQDWLNTEGGEAEFSEFVDEWLYLPGQSVDNYNNYFLLGFVTVRLPLASKEAKITDARRRGGGIIEDRIKEALLLMPETRSNWDIGYWDGPPAPIQGGIVIYLPNMIKNIFTESEIRARISKYVAAGSNFIVKFYEPTGNSTNETFYIYGESDPNRFNSIV